MTNNRYKNGCIYQIRTRDINKTCLYIGSCCNLTKRRVKHKSDTTNINSTNYNSPIYQHIRTIGGWESVICEELYKYPCESKKELEKEEGRKIQEIGIDLLYNHNVAGRTKKEYREGNKDKIRSSMRKYREDNKEKISKYYQDNKESFSIKNQKYYQDNKEKISIQRNKKMVCECGSEFRKRGRARHMKTKKHQSYVAD